MKRKHKKMSILTVKIRSFFFSVTIISTRNSYTIASKRDALKKLDANSGNIRRTARECKVSHKMIRDWRDKSSIILSGEFDRHNRRMGCGLRPQWPDIESKLVEWIHEEREKEKCVKYSRAIDKAKRLASESGNFDGKFGSSWLQKVLHRNKLTVRKATHYGQENRRSLFEQFEISADHLQDVRSLCGEVDPEFIIQND